jgi:hypothetical protein
MPKRMFFNKISFYSRKLEKSTPPPLVYFQPAAATLSIHDPHEPPQAPGGTTGGLLCFMQAPPTSTDASLTPSATSSSHTLPMQGSGGHGSSCHGRYYIDIYNLCGLASDAMGYQRGALTIRGAEDDIEDYAVALPHHCIYAIGVTVKRALNKSQMHHWECLEDTLNMPRLGGIAAGVSGYFLLDPMGKGKRNGEHAKALAANLRVHEFQCMFHSSDSPCMFRALQFVRKR